MIRPITCDRRRAARLCGRRAAGRPARGRRGVACDPSRTTPRRRRWQAARGPDPCPLRRGRDEPVPARLDLDRLSAHDRSGRGMAAAAVDRRVRPRRGRRLVRPRAWPAARHDQCRGLHGGRARRLQALRGRGPPSGRGARGEEAHLVQWLSKRLGYELRAPDLAGRPEARRRPAAAGPDAAPARVLHVRGPSGERFTLYCARSGAPETALRYSEAGRSRRSTGSTTISATS